MVNASGEALAAYSSSDDDRRKRRFNDSALDAR